MTTQALYGLAAGVFLAVFAGAASAQSASGETLSGRGGPVVSDVGAPPAEDRSSAGAIVLEKEPVRALRGDPARTDSRVMGAGPKPPAQGKTGSSGKKKEVPRDDGALIEK